MNIIQTSQIGLVRPKNEDRLLVRQNDTLTALLVCDGVGGSKAGDVAASMIVDYFNGAFDKQPTFTNLKEVKEWSIATFSEINSEIFALSHRYQQQSGMSSTAIFAMLTPWGDFYINIGDSRLYMVDSEYQLIQVSTDHSFVNDLVLKGTITLAQAHDHPMRHAVTNAFGIYQHLRYDLFDLSLPYHLLMLCSDGVSGYVEHYQLADILCDNHLSLSEKDDALRRLINDAGAYDNFTYILVEDRHG